MSQIDQTTGEVLDSLTGHEEMWIAEQFGKPIGELVESFLKRNDIGPYYRALIFVLKRRDNVNDDDARNAVLDMKLSDVLEFFPAVKPDDEDPDPEVVEVVEESGKDEPQSESSPGISLSSVS